MISFFCHVFTTSSLDLLQIHWILETEYPISRLPLWQFLSSRARNGPRKVQRLRNALISEEAACDGGTWIFPSGHPFKQQRLGFWWFSHWTKNDGFGGEKMVSQKNAGIRGSTGLLTVETWSQAEAKAELKVGDVSGVDFGVRWFVACFFFLLNFPVAWVAGLGNGDVFCLGLSDSNWIHHWPIQR